VTPYHADLASRPVPRYTSYPTAADFTPAIGATHQRAAIAAVAPGTAVSLYVHVPYCREICWYCGCNTGAVGREARLGAYRDALLAEIATVAALMRGRITAVHFGGGSPNVLPAADLVAVGDAIRAGFDVADDANWAAEIDPRPFDAQQAAALATIGVSRVSIGAQTFAPHVQRAINRIQPFEQVAAATRQLRAAGIAHVNLDLLYGLPHQRCDDIAATIASALTLAPARVAMFGYAHLPAMLPRQRMIDTAALPAPEERFRQSELAHTLFTRAGYKAIGFDHFARSGDSLARAEAAGRLRRNFQGFTDDPADIVIGLGASAVSRFDTLIVQNEKHVGRYRTQVATGELPGIRGVAIDADDRLRGAIIERLLCDGRVDIAAQCLHSGTDPRRFAGALASLSALQDREIVDRDGWRVAMRADSRPYRRIVAAAFDARRPAAESRTSVAV
jgi:oxygen-independent coproporphyrinogen-3 oxidase